MFEILNLVKIAKKKLISGNFDDFGKLLHETWMIKKNLNPIISNTNIDKIYNYAMNNGSIAKAVSTSTGSLKQMIEPKADSGSLANAASYASTCVLPKAAPQGLLCFTITQA